MLKKHPLKWSYNYDKCIACGTIDIKHHCHGLCCECTNTDKCKCGNTKTIGFKNCKKCAINKSREHRNWTVEDIQFEYDNFPVGVIYLAKKCKVKPQRICQLISTANKDKVFNVKCRVCGSYFKGLRSKKLCDKCAINNGAIRKKDLCKCGKLKSKVSKNCQKCNIIYDVAEWKYLYDNYYTSVDIGKYYGVSSAHIINSFIRKQYKTRSVQKAYDVNYLKPSIGKIPHYIGLFREQCSETIQ